MPETKWHALAVGEVLKELSVDPLTGLSLEEAGLRLEKYGANELTQEEKQSAWAMFFG
ncbi:MAG: cation-transporting P-type ATPase, partial [Thermodesulfobacteriota bacterium]